MENLEKIQEIGTTEKAWIEYAQAIDRNNENIRIALDGIIRKEVLQSTMKRIAIYVPFPNMKLPIFLKVQCASPTVPVFNIYYKDSQSGTLKVYLKNQSFDTEIEINIQPGYPYLYIYSTSIDDEVIEPVDYSFTYTTPDSMEYILNNIDLKGSKIVAFGDSITEFKDDKGRSYSDYIEKFYGAKVFNVGIGGTQIRQRTNPVEIPTSSNQAYAALDIINLVKAACSGDFTIQENAAEYLKNNTSDDNTAIVQILKSVDWDSVDAVTVFAGTNDWPSYSATLGESGSTDIGKTLGAVNEIIRLLSSTYPHVKIYWFTPIVRYSSYSISEWDDRYWSDRMGSTEQPYLPQSGSNEPNTSGSLKNGTLKDFSEAIENEVRLNHIPCCDMYNTLGWNKYNFSQYFNDSDGTHPKKGFKEIAKKIASFLIANKTF